jgi:hypothetical protein
MYPIFIIFCYNLFRENENKNRKIQLQKPQNIGKMICYLLVSVIEETAI